MADATVTEVEKRTARLERVRGSMRARAIAAVGILILVAGAAWWWLSRGTQSTDDAQVDGDVIPIAAKVGGVVKDLKVDDNQAVQPGTVLASIDPRDYEAAVARAEADLREAQASVAAAEAGASVASASAKSQLTAATAGRGNAAAGIALAKRDVEAAEAKLAAARARQREADANLTRTTQDVQRLKPLAEKDEVSRQQFDAVVAAQRAAQAGLDSAAATVVEAETGVAAAQSRLAQARGELTQAASAESAARTAPQQMAVANARVAAARAQVAQAEAALRQAKLNLGYATVHAPCAGMVSQVAVKPGQIVQPGQPLMALVPLQDVWITANFKETQLASMRPGQRAEIEVDAYDGKTYSGHVESLAPATGARFSLLPPDNASGNYVKVVQRVPVRIALDGGQDPTHPLRPGMSVSVTVFNQ
jgi:membrane fusion protein (multidrug efflux system)